MEKQSNELENWSEVIKHYAELQKQADESKKELVSELLEDADRRDKRKNRIIVGLIVAMVILVIYSFISGTVMITCRKTERDITITTPMWKET